MKRSGLFVFLICLIALCTNARAQTDDIRAATGLPIPIGAQVIYGKVDLRGLGSKDPRPVINVSLLSGGVQIDRNQTNDRGWYYFLRAPGDGMTLLFEANNMEVGRVVLSAGTGSSIRQDIEVDWRTISDTSKPPGTISVRDTYRRAPDAEKIFDKAAAAAKAKKNTEAIELFRSIVEKDDKDFAAWTELGTVYFVAGDTDKAAHAYEKALAAKPDFMPGLMNSGKLYLSVKNYDLASKAFFKAVSVDPKSADAFAYLGETYLQSKQGSKAVIALNEALRLAPVEKAELHLRLAALYNGAGAKDRAAGEYRQFLAKVPNFADKEKLEKYIRENGK